LNRTTTNYFLVLFFSIIPVISFSQGNGSDGAITVAGTTYTDGVETNLNSTTASGNGSIIVTSSAGFAVGQQILIIQIIGTGVGHYEENNISAIAGTTITLAHNTTNTYTVAAGSVVEVMKIMQYTNITINNGGVLTAHPWAGTTGGVMYFYASGTITVNAGGKITMDGLGYRGGAGGLGGAGSAGLATVGTGATTAGGNGTNGGNGLGGSGNAGAGGGGTGGAGGGENATIGTTGTAGSAGEGPNPGNNNSSYLGTLEMGGGGKGASGGTGGYGGGAGGGGGADINNFCGCGLSATNGSAGSAGSTGSTGSVGGNGGGIMVIYVNTLTGGGTLTAKGTQGGAGGTGGNGGAGGNGGYGGFSGCGGTGGGGGGGGNGGDGGPGGQGGNGGAGGTIWLNYFTNTLTLAASATAGAAGTGGTQGNGGTAGFGGVCFSNSCPGNGIGPGSTGSIGNSGSGTNGGTGSSGSAGAAGSGPISGGNPLPIRLLSFNAAYNQSLRNVELDWSTGSEKNNKSFIVEKTSDCKNWEQLAELQGAGNSDHTINYNAIDESPGSGILYYRIKQTDYDGNSTYSNTDIININLANSNSLTLSPNPANKFVNVNFTSSFSGNTTIRIYTGEGKLFDTVQTEIKKGQNSIMLDVSKYPNGIYIVLLNISGDQYSTKLIVNHY
jgi:hypothetical protein